MRRAAPHLMHDSSRVENDQSTSTRRHVTNALLTPPGRWDVVHGCAAAAIATALATTAEPPAAFTASLTAAAVAAALAAPSPRLGRQTAQPGGPHRW